MVAASVRIAKYQAGGKSIALGSGVCVATRRYTDYTGAARFETLVITAKHVVAGGPGDGNKAFVVTFPAGTSYRYASLEATDPAADLAALSITAPDGNDPVIPLGASAMSQGEPIWLVGYPLGSGPLARVGKVRGNGGLTDARVPVVSLSVYSDQGDSGCGVFRPSDRSLVGILWGGSDRHDDAAVTGLDNVRAFLETRCARWFPGRQRPAQPSPTRPPAIDPPLQPTTPAMPPVAPSVPSGPGTPPSQPADPGPTRPDRLSQLDQLAADVAAGRAAREKLAERLGQAEGLIGKTHDRLAAAEGLLGKTHDRLTAAEGMLGKAHDAIGLLNQATGETSPRLQKVEEVLGRAQNGLAKAEAMHDTLGRVETKLGAIEPALGAAAAVGGWAGWLPWIAGGAATGGIAPLIGLGLWGVRALARRKSGPDGSGNPIPATPGQGSQVLVQTPVPQPAQQLPPVLVQAPAPPNRTEPHYVGVPTSNAELAALKTAMDKYAQMYPGAAGQMQTVQKLAKTIESGGQV